MCSRYLLMETSDRPRPQCTAALRAASAGQRAMRAIARVAGTFGKPTGAFEASGARHAAPLDCGVTRRDAYLLFRRSAEDRCERTSISRSLTTTNGVPHPTAGRHMGPTPARVRRERRGPRRGPPRRRNPRDLRRVRGRQRHCGRPHHLPRPPSPPPFPPARGVCASRWCSNPFYIWHTVILIVRRFVSP